jgi:hypothetical protein
MRARLAAFGCDNCNGSCATARHGMVMNAKEVAIAGIARNLESLIMIAILY